MLRRPATRIMLTQEDIVRYEESRAQQQAEKAAGRERQTRDMSAGQSFVAKGKSMAQHPVMGESPTEESPAEEALVHDSRLIDQHESQSRTAQALSAQQQRRARVDPSGSPSAGNTSAAGTVGATRSRPVASRARHARTTSSSRGGRATAQTDIAQDRTDATDEARQRAAQRRARILGRGAPAPGSLG